MYHSSIFSFVLLSISTIVTAQNTYWIDSSCKTPDKSKFLDALSEAISNAGSVAEALKVGDTRLSLPLNWFFNLNIQHVPHTELIQNTFRRISQLTETTDHISSNLRIYCDNNARYIAVDNQGNPLPRPPTDIEEIKTTKYFDKTNWSIVLGTKLECQVSNALAHGYIDIVKINNVIKLPQPNPVQPLNRVTMTFCDSLFVKNSKPNFPHTARDFAKLDLERNMHRLWKAGALMFNTITHELVHVPFLSSNEVSYLSAGENGLPIEVNGIATHGMDKHGVTKTVGYFRGGLNDNHPDTTLPGPRLVEWGHTVMNPDSYAFFGLIWKLRGKQWEAFEEVLPGGKKIVKVRKNLNLALVGDTPGGPSS